MRTFNLFQIAEDKYFVVRIIPLLKPVFIHKAEFLYKKNSSPECGITLVFLNYFFSLFISLWQGQLFIRN